MVWWRSELNKLLFLWYGDTLDWTNSSFYGVVAQWTKQTPLFMVWWHSGLNKLLFVYGVVAQWTKQTPVCLWWGDTVDQANFSVVWWHSEKRNFCDLWWGETMDQANSCFLWRGDTLDRTKSWLFIHMSIIWIHVMSHPVSGRAVMRSKISNFEQYKQTVLTNVFISALLTGTIDFYYFVPLLFTLILPGGHKVSTNQDLLALSFRTLFIWSRWNLIWWWSNSSWTSQD